MSISKNINITGSIGYKLKQTQHSLRLGMDKALKILNLTTPQYAVLAQLELRPRTSNADLARASFITAQTMHKIVSNLENRDLVKRQSDPCHGRILSTELTEQGVAVVQDAHKIVRIVEKTMTSTMTENNKYLLDSFLIECFNNLNDKE